jgi:hypothetical protein
MNYFEQDSKDHYFNYQIKSSKLIKMDYYYFVFKIHFSYFHYLFNLN